MFPSHDQKRLGESEEYFWKTKTEESKKNLPIELAKTTVSAFDPDHEKFDR
jgi:hypothetical protein